MRERERESRSSCAWQGNKFPFSRQAQLLRLALCVFSTLESQSTLRLPRLLETLLSLLFLYFYYVVVFFLFFSYSKVGHRSVTVQEQLLRLSFVSVLRVCLLLALHARPALQHISPCATDCARASPVPAVVCAPGSCARAMSDCCSAPQNRGICSRELQRISRAFNA